MLVSLSPPQTSVSPTIGNRVISCPPYDVRPRSSCLQSFSAEPCLPIPGASFNPIVMIPSASAGLRVLAHSAMLPLLVSQDSLNKDSLSPWD